MTVDVYILLDVLLIILIALFIPIGFWRGAFRESFVTLGILFGAVMAIFWAEPWGADLALISRLHESGGAFMVAMLCLIGSTFVLGYSAGAVVPVPPPGWIARTLGALIAGTNGALLLSFALGDIRAYLLSADEADFLDNAVVAPFLSDGTGWILLISAAVFVPIVLVVALFGPTYEIEDYYETGEYDSFEDEDDEIPYPLQAMPSEDRVANSSVRRGPSHADATRPIPAVESSVEDTQPGSSASVESSTAERIVTFGFRPEPPPAPANESPEESDPRSDEPENAERTVAIKASVDSENDDHGESLSEQDKNADETPRAESRSSEESDEESDDSSLDGTEEKPAVGLRCPHCNANVPAGHETCPACGKKVDMTED